MANQALPISSAFFIRRLTASVITAICHEKQNPQLFVKNAANVDKGKGCHTYSTAVKAGCLEPEGG